MYNVGFWMVIVGFIGAMLSVLVEGVYLFALGSFFAGVMLIFIPILIVGLMFLWLYGSD